ncbi:hypothetical protein [Streptomyces sirii]|uniref:hypothetical protein n=1 Tax=Streptomyces sirii TaxID=3127701 RepID=UPI003D36208E
MVLRTPQLIPLHLLSASAALFGTLFVATYFLQDVLGLDPLQCGLRALPPAMMSPRTPLASDDQLGRSSRKLSTGADR